MSEDAADYSQWTSEDLTANFHFHSQHPEVWGIVSRTENRDELEEWLEDCIKDCRSQRWHYIRHRVLESVVALLAIGVALFLAMAPMGWIGKDPGTFGLIVGLASFWLILLLLVTHPALRAPKGAESKSTKIARKLEIIEASRQMIEFRIKQIDRLARSEGMGPKR